MYVIVGLGNPGLKYDRTRHNVGFETIDKFAAKHNIKLDKEKFKAILGEGNINGEKVVLVMPLTYMNLSGESVQAVLAWHKVTPDKLIVVYDDISLDVGNVRTRPKGSAGGHNGMKNIISMIGNDNFPRVRVGVGDKPKDWDLADYVLSQFSKEERFLIEQATDKACMVIETIIKDGIDKAMNLYN